MQSLKVLVVEDDDSLREILVEMLKTKKIQVHEAPNGKAAKEMLLLNPVDLVISDIQMPHFSGIDLLEWIKKNMKTKVILMTGFSQILETEAAINLGADDFLAKPFKQAELIETIEKHFKKETPAAVITENLDSNYCKISIEDFLTDKETACELFIRISNAKYVKIAHKGGKITEDRVKIYKDKGVFFVYVRKEDFSHIVNFNLKVAKVVGTSRIDAEKKKNFIRSTSELILESAFVNGVDDESYKYATEFVKDCMGVLCENDETFELLEILSTHADYLYAHSLGVSSFAVMIGKELGWNSSLNSSRLAIGGLMHDIGKKEIEKEILEKPRHLLSLKERKLIETHPTRGKEILESLPNIPTEVINIVYEHHENNVGQGFPRGISKKEIHPLVGVVAVANIFCGYCVKRDANTKPITAPEALKQMETFRIHEMDSAAFGALKRLFAKK